jgi:hypothetical protein
LSANKEIEPENGDEADIEYPLFHKTAVKLRGQTTESKRGGV